MIDDNIKKYILNYLEKDKSTSAIMLEGPWGCGKTYFIKNDLIPFLNKNRKKIITVSVYGLNTLEELCKSIYYEKINFGNKNVKTKIIGKTIFKGITSFIGIDLSLSKSDLNKLYKSVDLEDVLIILEDIERSNINIIELLSFVNSLVEQDNVKVLLIANENELIKTIDNTPDDDGNKKARNEYPDETKKYFKVKEKTISYTFSYIPNLKNSVSDIFNKLSNINLEKNKLKFLINEVVDSVMNDTNNSNLRALIFAIHKIAYLFNEIIKIEINEDLKVEIALSVIAYCLRKNKNYGLIWIDDKEINPINLGTIKYPLYRWVYEFVENNYLDEDALISHKEAYDLLLSKTTQDKNYNEDFDIVREYYYQTEEKLVNSVKSLIYKLEKNQIEQKNYLTLISYFIVIKHLGICENEIENAKNFMLDNLKNSSTFIEEFKSRYLDFRPSIQMYSEKEYEEYDLFIKKINNTIKQKKNIKIESEQKYTNLSSLCEEIISNEKHYPLKHKFCFDLNILKLVELIKKSNAKEIDSLSAVFSKIYRISNVNEYYSADLKNLIYLKTQIESLLENDGFDRIIKLQLNWFKENIEEYIKKIDHKK